MLNLPFPSLSELYVQVSSTGQLTPNDRCGLRAALLDEWTNEDERQAIDRLLYAIRVGRVQVLS
jgi:hypothetical protein